MKDRANTLLVRQEDRPLLQVSTTFNTDITLNHQHANHVKILTTLGHALFSHGALLRGSSSEPPYLIKTNKMDYLQEDYYQPGPASTLPTYQPDPYNGMPPPTEGEFADLPALMAACQEHAREHGYACVTSSNNYKRGIAYVRCDRGGEYVNHWKLTEETRVRKNRTRRLVGCTWKARAKRTSSGSWVLTMMNDKHNGHTASTTATAHPSLRQLPPQAVDEARRAFKQAVSPKEVLELLQSRYNPAITAQDVYNLKAKIIRTDQQASQNIGEVGNGTSREEVVMDPALEIQGSIPSTGGETRMGKCACQCCHH